MYICVYIGKILFFMTILLYVFWNPAYNPRDMNVLWLEFFPQISG